MTRPQFSPNKRAFRRAVVMLSAAMVAFAPQVSFATKLVMKDGRVLEGKVARISSLAEKLTGPPKTGVQVTKIILCDDGLRRTFVSYAQVQPGVEQPAGDTPEKITFRNVPAARSGQRVASVGPISEITPFDEFGHRKIEMLTKDGPRSVFQSITEITPTWTKVEALTVKGLTFVWDQRIATTSIPHDLLDKVIRKQIDPKKVEDRLLVVRLYLQMERYEQAREELKQVIADFPEHADQFSRTERMLRQRYAQRVLDEVEVRRKAGRHGMAFDMLQSFPNEGVAGETLQKVRQYIDAYTQDHERGKEVLKQLDEQIALVADTKLRGDIQPVRDEIVAELNMNTLERMAAFRQGVGDATMPPEDRVALAVSGWLMGSDAAIRKLPVALSLFKVRNGVREYLVESVKLNRDAILANFQSQEGGTLEYVDLLIKHMKPPRPMPEPSGKTHGLYELTVDSVAGQMPVNYLIQLPPEYDPYRRYPTIVSLHGAGTNPSLQVDWWAGDVAADGSRLGQTTRHGYIVIAPAWTTQQQREYRYSAEEHAAVLNCLRDACRRFAIDTDRVFLSGHSAGGDAAWDIGLAHPDLWAGVIPIVAVADKYVARYWENAKYVPFYLVCGELDANKIATNARDLERYFTFNYDATVAEYQGRGHENFSDEILRLFDWMGRKQRDFANREFAVRSMRPWDSYFWWLEVEGLPPNTQVLPDDWPPQRNANAAQLKGRVYDTGNNIMVTSGARRTTIWLSPELVDFKRKINITVNGAPLRGAGAIEPDLAVLLEDVRTRGDRLHPFWAKVEAPGGRVNVAER